MEHSPSEGTKQFTIENKFNSSPTLLLVLEPQTVSILNFQIYGQIYCRQDYTSTEITVKSLAP
jgi:hypothetical protein